MPKSLVLLIEEVLLRVSSKGFRLRPQRRDDDALGASATATGLFQNVGER